MTDLRYVGRSDDSWECPNGHRWAFPAGTPAEDLASCALCRAGEELDRLRGQIVKLGDIAPLADLAVEINGKGWYSRRFFSISLDHRMQVFGETPAEAAVSLVSLAIQRAISARHESILRPSALGEASGG